MNDESIDIEKLLGRLELLLPTAGSDELRDEAGVLSDLSESLDAVRNGIRALSAADGIDEVQSALIELMIRVDLARSRLARSYPLLQLAMTDVLGEKWDPWIKPEAD